MNDMTELEKTQHPDMYFRNRIKKLERKLERAMSFIDSLIESPVVDEWVGDEAGECKRLIEEMK